MKSNIVKLFLPFLMVTVENLSLRQSTSMINAAIGIPSALLVIFCWAFLTVIFFMDIQPHQFMYVRKRKTTKHDNPGEAEGQSSCISIDSKCPSLLNWQPDMLNPKADVNSLYDCILSYLHNSCYIICVLEGDRKETEGETIRAHKGKRTTGLFLVGLSAFTRILRSTSLNRIQCFFHRLFIGWTWPYKLEIKLQNQKC